MLNVKLKRRVSYFQFLLIIDSNNSDSDFVNWLLFGN